MKSFICIVLAFAIALKPIPAQAWSEGGHHIIALLAFDLLSKDEQSKLLTTLEKHPRYKEDFEPAEKLPNDTEVTRWRVGRAGYCPDVARRQPKYRSTWHYELGSALTIGSVMEMACKRILEGAIAKWERKGDESNKK